MKRKIYYAATIFVQVETGNYYAEIIHGSKEYVSDATYGIYTRAYDWMFDDPELGKCVYCTASTAETADEVLSMICVYAKSALERGKVFTVHNICDINQEYKRWKKS